MTDQLNEREREQFLNSFNLSEKKPDLLVDMKYDNMFLWEDYMQ